jgi:SAM-dependent methyltransferase
MEHDPHAERYDEVAYPNLVHGRSHPRTVGALATLYGLDPAPVETARVLDLGCAAGMNIIAMAEELPAARFVGVDISPRQIAAARATAAELGLENVTFECASFDALDNFADGRFDYIICHGVFTWVAPPLRDIILAVTKRLLAPNGVAYLSYNVYPGWQFGQIVRELMWRESDPEKPALERVLDARRTLERHLEAAEEKSLRRALLLAERETLEGHSDSYLFHEYLTPEHHPLYFVEFVKLASAAGLAYVSDAHPGVVLPTTQEPRLRALIDHLPPERRDDPVWQQQMIDEHLNNRFRRSLVVHDHHRPALTLENAHRLHLRLPREHILVREGDTGLGVRSRRSRLIPIPPFLEAPLERLRAASPASLPAADLCAHLSEDPQLARASLAILVGLVFAEVLEPTLSPVCCASSLPQRPAVTPLNRLQARRRDPIASRLFASEHVGELGQELVSLLDGTRTVTELCETLSASSDRVEGLLRAFVEHGLLLPEG